MKYLDEILVVDRINADDVWGEVSHFQDDYISIR